MAQASALKCYVHSVLSFFFFSFLSLPVAPSAKPTAAQASPAHRVALSSFVARVLSQVAPSAKPTAAQASPGHLVMCWNALIYGAASATGKAFEGKGGVEAWTDTFQESSSSAAAAMTPVGGFVLKTHVFKSQ